MYFVHVEEIEATVKVYKVGSHGHAVEVKCAVHD
jgi:hypothetical protein